MKKFSLIIILSVLIINFMPGNTGWCDEPTMSTYIASPIFQTSAVDPNILILLDNSTSMNWAAYAGTYAGEPYSGRGKVSVSINASSDDATEKDGTLITSGSLYLGYYNSGSYTVGLRFQDLSIPNNATITNAYITFTSRDTLSNETSLEIYGEDVDSADTFSSESTISDRTSWTDAVVAWSLTSSDSWQAPESRRVGHRNVYTYYSYNTPDLSEVVQEVVSRDGWASGQDMAFKISYAGTGTSNAYRHAYSYDDETFSHTHAATLVVEYVATEDSSAETYYGYFNPEYFYTYNSSNGWFEHAYKKDYYDYVNGYWVVKDLTGSSDTLTDAEIASEGLWDGNWMNWATMRRYDVLKKVLIGGKSATTTITEDEEEVTYTYIAGEIPSTDHEFDKEIDASAGPAVTPVGLASETYTIADGKIYMDSTGYWLHIKKDVDCEPKDFDSSGNLAGILQKIGNRASWGNEFFYQNDGSGTSYDGGKVFNELGSDISTIASSISDESTKRFTPLGESLYTSVRYFMQEQIETSGYESDCTFYVSSGGVKGTEYDPYYRDDEAVYCAKSYVLLLTDGAATSDSNIPSTIPDFDNDGTRRLDDVAYYMHVNDLRSDLGDMQNLTLYAVLAFDDDEDAVDLLIDAAINGGFTDKDGDNKPGPHSYYDSDGDFVEVQNSEYILDENGYPENFYKAADGYLLEQELLSAINDILKRAASGTAVSVLATSSEGEGNLIQAYFKPVIPSGLDEIKWGGYIQSLWVDAYGNLREDTEKDKKLDITEDKIIRYFTDEDTGNTKVNRWDVSEDTPYPDMSEEDPVELEIDDITPIWEGAEMLADRDPDDRKIFTYIDIDDDHAVSDSDPFDTSGEVIAFSAASSCDASSLIGPYLGIVDDTTWGELGTEYDDRVDNLINYIRGTDVAGFRSRTINNKVWKLGDIIHSTPVSVSKPTDNYHVIYGDEDYGTYYKNNLNRETVIYVGANDGMLHAFTSGVYSATDKKFNKKESTSEEIGDELWAYIPQALLPHLKWLADPDYGDGNHVYYCDLKPKVFDAKIDTDSDNKPDTWKTLLLLGLNLGGKAIDATGDFDYDDEASTADTTRTFSSSYTLIDITDPRNPDVLWERSYDDLGLTTSFPAVIKVGEDDDEKWFAVFGSGPSDYDGTADGLNGHVYIVDLSTGAPYQSSTDIDWLFATTETNAFMNSPVSVDVGLNYNVDAIYFGDTYLDTAEDPDLWKGKLYKVVVPWSIEDEVITYSSTPNDSTSPWTFVTLFDAEKPITSSCSLSMDSFDNVWVYVGSGRYLSDDDKSNSDQQYMFGIKDPFYNKLMHSSDGYYHNFGDSLVLEKSDLLNSDPYLILDNGTVYLDLDDDGTLDSDEYAATPYGNWSDLLTAVRAEDGWIRSLTISGERIVTKFTILGGIVFTPSFVPNDDICGYSGDSYLYGQYYETGTAYYKAGLKTYELYDGENVVATQVLDKTTLGLGMASSVGVHVGSEQEPKGFVQTSSGDIIEVDLETAFKVKSGLRSWREK